MLAASRIEFWELARAVIGRVGPIRTIVNEKQRERASTSSAKGRQGDRQGRLLNMINRG